MTQAIARAAREYSRPDTEITAVEPLWGPEVIEGFFEAYVSIAAVLERLATLGSDADAVVLAGYGEPGRDALRQLLEVPVFDITECSAHMACLVGYQFGIVTTLDASVPQIVESLRGVGLLERCAAIRATGMGGLDVRSDLALAQQRIEAEARTILDTSTAEVICLGGGAMVGLDKELERSLGVPVIDGIAAAVKMAEACVDYGLRTSRHRAYAKPRPKKIIGWNNSRTHVEAERRN